MTNERVDLGDIAKDAISGFKGTVVAETQWLFGCRRLTLQPEGTTKDGKLHDTNTFDEGSIVVVKKGAHAPKPAKLADIRSRGGPRPEPVRAADPVR
jgi:hypothetical protein